MSSHWRTLIHHGVGITGATRCATSSVPVKHVGPPSFPPLAPPPRSWKDGPGRRRVLAACTLCCLSCLFASLPWRSRSISSAVALANRLLYRPEQLRRRPRDEKHAEPALICAHDFLLFCITQCSLQPDKPIRLYEPLWAAALPPPPPLIRSGELSSASARPICTVSMNI